MIMNIKNLFTGLIFLYIALLIGIYASYIDSMLNMLLRFVLKMNVYQFPISMILSILFAVAGIVSIDRKEK